MKVEMSSTLPQKNSQWSRRGSVSLGFMTDEEREPIPGVHDQKREGGTS